MVSVHVLGEPRSSYNVFQEKSIPDLKYFVHPPMTLHPQNARQHYATTARLQRKVNVLGTLTFMSTAQLSDSTQDYLKAIWLAGEWSDEPITATSISQRVGVTLSTTSDALRRLRQAGLIDHAPYSAITLTDIGRVHAVDVVRRHRLIETFLVQALGYTWDQVHDEAEVLEHAVSDFMVYKIAEYLGHPDRDPHGDPIPSADGSVERLTAIPLTELGFGVSAVVERIADDDPKLLQYFASQGVAHGTVVELAEGAPFSDTVTLVAQEARLTLGPAAVDAVWVTPV